MKTIGIAVLTLCLAFGLTVRGGAVYVATNAAPAAPYDTWANAFTNVQDALDWAADPGNNIATIHLAGHAFVAGGDGESVYRFENATNVILRGGYEGISGGAGNEPGAHDPSVWTTVVARADGGGNGRVLTVTDSSNVVFEALTFRDGNLAGEYGGGILVSGSADIRFDDCRVVSNRLVRSGLVYGGGLAMLDSTATLTNTLLSGNFARDTSTGSSRHGAHGGAVFVDGGSQLAMIRSLVRDNTGYGARFGALGGAIHIAAHGALDIRETVIVDNQAILHNNNTSSALKAHGGAIYNAGNLNLRNVLVARNFTDNKNGGPAPTLDADGIHHVGGSLTLVNCTVVDNWTQGSHAGDATHVGIFSGGGTVAITNSIVWGHDRDLVNLPVDDGGHWPDVWYSCIGDPRNDNHQGSLTVDPLFVDDVTYHLESDEGAGHWSGSYFSGGVFGDAGGWSLGAAKSPLIDRGHPDSDWSREPEPNGNWINIGAYGNTEVASQSDGAYATPTVVNPGAAVWGRTTVRFRADVTDAGGELPEVNFLYWEVGGSETSVVAAGYFDGLHERPHSGLTPDTEYRYRVSAQNSMGVSYSSESAFTTHAETPIVLYVSTNGSHGAGTTWTSAYRDLKTALAIVGPGDTLRLAGHTFADEVTTGNDHVFLMQNFTNVTVLGGYEGVSGGEGNEAGARNPNVWTTVVARAANDFSGRVLTVMNASNVVFEALTVRDGYNTNPDNIIAHGGGILVSGSRDILFDGCRILDNTVIVHSASTFGGGLALVDSAVTVTNSLIADNFARYARIGSNVHGGDGGGASVDGNSSLMVNRSIIRDNIGYGGRSGARGGAFYVAAGGLLDVRESVIVDNNARIHSNNTGPRKALGGAIYNAGSVSLRNVLMAGNRTENMNGAPHTVSLHADGIHHAGGSLTLVNCTIVDNWSDASSAGDATDIGIYFGGGSVAVTNSIVWGHDIDLAEFPTDGAGYWPDVWYSCIGDPRNDDHQGSLTVDPLFVNQVTYHLQSTVGHWSGSYFKGGVFGDDGGWTTAAADSPLIDRGHPDSDWSREPEPNGSWINIGAYGNTDVASQSLGAQALPTVENPGATSWGRTTVRFRANVTDSGGELPLVQFLYWEVGNAVTSTVAAGYLEGFYELPYSGLTPDTDYRYRISAQNSLGTAYSEDADFSTRAEGPATIYVATNGAHTAGTSWQTAYRDLKTALAMTESGDALYLAGHVFSDEVVGENDFVFEIQQLTNILVRGGYEGVSGGAGNEAGARDSSVWTTVVARLTSGFNGRVMNVTESSNVVFEALTFRDGNLLAGEYGGGILVSGSADIRFDGCRIIENTISRSGATHGGGLALVGSTVTVTNSLIGGNFARDIRTGSNVHGGDGGGASVDGNSRLMVNRSIVRDNIGYGGRNGARGGAFYVAAGGLLDVRESEIVNNNARVHDNNANQRKALGGAIYNAGSVSLRNVLVASNRTENMNGAPRPVSLNADGIHHAGGSLALINCTVADNWSDAVSAGDATHIGITHGGGTVAITNTIVWNHDVSIAGETAAVGYSNIEGETVYAGDENINADPSFVAAAEGDYRLQLGSPAIDSGLNQAWMAGATDLDGLPRVMMGTVDMGCYEAIPPTGTLILLR